jgi:hypothetical protein
MGREDDNNDDRAGKPVPYGGPSGIGRDSVWLTAEDLPDEKDITLEIEEVLDRQNVTFEGGRKKPHVLTLKFARFQRELGLNATNRRSLNRLYGKITANWRGKRVTLYVDNNVRFGRETVSGVRIRDVVPQPKSRTTTDAQPAAEPAGERVPGAEG